MRVPVSPHPSEYFIWSVVSNFSPFSKFIMLSCWFFFFFPLRIHDYLFFFFFQMFGLFFHLLYLIKYPLLSSAYFMNFGYFRFVFSFFFLTSRTKMYIEESSIFTG